MPTFFVDISFSPPSHSFITESRACFGVGRVHRINFSCQFLRIPSFTPFILSSTHTHTNTPTHLYMYIYSRREVSHENEEEAFSRLELDIMEVITMNKVAILATFLLLCITSSFIEGTTHIVYASFCIFTLFLRW